MRRGQDDWLSVTAHLDPIFRLPVMSCSLYVTMFGQARLNRRTRIGKKVHTIWPTRHGVRLMFTSVGTVQLHLDLTTDPHHPIHILVIFELLEDRNDRGLAMLGMSLPRSVYDAFPGQIRNMQRSSNHCCAFWQAEPPASVWRMANPGSDRLPQYSPSSPDPCGDERPRAAGAGAVPSVRMDQATAADGTRPDVRLLTAHLGEPLLGTQQHSTLRRVEHVAAAGGAPPARQTGNMTYVVIANHLPRGTGAPPVHRAAVARETTDYHRPPALPVTNEGR